MFRWDRAFLILVKSGEQLEELEERLDFFWEELNWQPIGQKKFYVWQERGDKNLFNKFASIIRLAGFSFAIIGFKKITEILERERRGQMGLIKLLSQ